MNGAILTNRTAYDRNQADFYDTPTLATVALIDFLESDHRISKNSIIWEPACGAGKLANVLIDRGYEVVCTDLNNFGYGNTGVDFLKTNLDCDWIITNPPFSNATAFIKHALQMQKKCAFLLKSQFWHAKSRIDLFYSNPPTYILPLTWRPDFLYGKKSGSPTMEVIWTIWDGTHESKYLPLKKPTN